MQLLIVLSLLAISKCLALVPQIFYQIPSFLAPIKSVQEMDEANLRGLRYDDEQPVISDPKEFAGKRIAILVSHCFEDLQLYFPYEYFKRRGATVNVITPNWITDKVAACEFVVPSAFVRPHSTVGNLGNDRAFDAVLIPGGISSSTVLRNDEMIIEWIRKQRQNYRAIIGFICTGASLAIQLNIAKNRVLTGSKVVRVDLENAGGIYKDVPVIEDPHAGFVFGRDSSGKGTLLFTEAVGRALKQQ